MLLKQRFGFSHSVGDTIVLLILSTTARYCRQRTSRKGGIAEFEGVDRHKARLRYDKRLRRLGSDAVATAVLAYVQVAKTALEDVLPVAVGAELTAKTLPRLAVGLAFEAPRVFAFMTVSELVKDVIDALLPNRTR